MRIDVPAGRLRRRGAGLAELAGLGIVAAPERFYGPAGARHVRLG